MKNEDCCNEYAGLSRRGLLKGALATGAGLSIAAAHGSVFTETAYAVTGRTDQVLVVLSMRGAADGLSLVVPHADPAYYQARPSIGIAKDRLLVPDAMFGLHPAFAPLVPMWTSGKMAAIHATGQIVTTRSHFAAMEEVEDAAPGSGVRSGWLNRLLSTDGSGSPLEGVQYGGGVTATQFAGPSPVLAAVRASSIRLAGPDDAKGSRDRRRALKATWGKGGGPLKEAARRAMVVDSEFAKVRNSSDKPQNGAQYPDDDLARALLDTARTIKANVGAQLITVDQGDWDHHIWVGKPEDGNLKRRAEPLAQSLAAFFQDLGPWADKVTVITLSEFGRRVKENASGGLDHGHGNVMLALGAGVKGGRYYGRWPGLQNSADADLAVTTDYRAVLADVVASRFPAASLPSVFPGLQRDSLGFMA